MYYAFLDCNGFFRRYIIERREKNETYFKVFQWCLLVVGWYLGTCPYQQTLGSIGDSMWMPLYWMAPAMSPPHKHDRSGAAVFCLLVIIFPCVLAVATPFQKFCDEQSVDISNKFCNFFQSFSICNCLKEKKKLAEAKATEPEIVTNAMIPAAVVEDVESKPTRTQMASFEIENPKSDNAGVHASSNKEVLSIDAEPHWLLSKNMMLLYFVILLIIIGAIPSKPFTNCYSPTALGGIQS